MPTPLDYASFRNHYLDTGEWTAGEQHCRDILDQDGGNAAMALVPMIFRLA